MKTIVIVLLACVVSPALADMYRCNTGGKTIYQDVPCPGAKVIDNTNGQAPSRYEQMRAMERTSREKALATRLNNNRGAEDRRTTRTTTTSTLQTTVSSSPEEGKPNGPDRYYDRPDRYYDRPDRNKNRNAKRLDNPGQNTVTAAPAGAAAGNPHPQTLDKGDRYFSNDGSVIERPPGSSFAHDNRGNTYFKPEGSAFSYGKDGKTCFHYGDFANCK